MGGGLAIELAAAYEQEKNQNNKSATDIILIEPATTNDYSPTKMGYHFTLGSYLATYQRYRKQGLSRRQSFIQANRETRISWATIMENAKVVNQPISHMTERNQFPNASQRNHLTIKDAQSHSFAMVDDGRMMNQIAKWLTTS